MRALVLLAALLAFAAPAQAWNNHGLVAYWTFRAMPEVAQAPDAKVEPLDDFLRDQEPAIASLLDEQERWAREKLKPYPPRPDALAFKADPGRDAGARRTAFFEALRIAGNTKFTLFLHPEPQKQADAARALRWADVSTLREPAFSFHRYYRVEPGETVSALSVLTTASDEPDLGTDINCWEDSPSDWGKRYGFGKLPFGNPTLDFSTQAPFHMGFFHQSWIIYKAAPFVARTYPRLRAQQFLGLARLAFRTGHDYWGWRFAGNALHYAQDLTQPYHASMLPGVSTTRMIFVNLIAMAGWPKMKNDQITLVSNRHLALERYQAQLVNRAMTAGAPSALLDALQSPAKDTTYPKWSDAYLVDTLTAESHDAGERLNDALLATVPAAYVSDPAFDFGAQGGRIDLFAELSARTPEQRAGLDALISELLGHFGSHSRNFLRAMLVERPAAAAR